MSDRRQRRRPEPGTSAGAAGKPTATQLRVATFLAEVAAECSRDPADSEADYFQRVATEFKVSAEALASAANGNPLAFSPTDARKLSRAIGPS